MLDSSPAVRDAALELVGKYVVARPDLAAEYLPKICARTNVSRSSFDFDTLLMATSRTLDWESDDESSSF